MSSRSTRAFTTDPSFSRYRLHVCRSHIHRRGVFAAERIPAGREVIEYTGQRTSVRSLLKRAERMTVAACRKLVYFARVNRYWLLNGAVGGSGAEFINHSCDPNLYPRRTHGHILLFSRRTIQPGEELTWEYRYPEKDGGISCRCGSPKCRGKIEAR